MRSASRRFFLSLPVRILLVAVTALGLLASPGAGSAVATTHERISAALSLRISSGTAAPGAALLISGTGFSSNERVDLYVGVRAAGAVTAGADGSFTGARFTVPATTPPGTVTVLANGRYSRFTAQSALLVRSGWAEPGHDARHTRTATEENVIGPQNVARLTPEASIGTDDGPRAVTVANGAVYLTFGDGSGFSSVPVGAGGVSWTHPDPEAVNGSTVASATRVFYPSGSELQAVDARTGKGLWRTSYGANGSQNAVSAFEYGDGAVYVVASVDYQHTLSRLSAATGEIAWTVSGTYDSQPPAVADGVVYARESGSAVEAIDAATGERLWTTTVPGTDTGVLAVSGKYLVAPFPYGLAALDRSTGAIVWNTAAGVTGNVAIAGDRLVANYFDFATGRIALTALDLATGTPIWRNDAYDSTPSIANGVVYTGHNQQLYAYSLADGALLATFDLPEQDPNSLPYLDAPVSIADGEVYVPLQYFGNRFEGAAIYRYAQPDRFGVPAVSSVDDTVTGSGDGQFRYGGGWVAGSRPGAYSGTFHYARSTGATATFSFTGVGARLWYSTAPGFGKVSVSIDGKPVVTLDQSSPVRRDGVKSWTGGALAAGTHTLVVRSSSSSVVDIDRLDVGTF